MLYEYLRNNDLDAKNFFDRPGPIPGYKRNQYGGSVGGPIKKNKTFYFGNFEGARVRQGITKVATEPTAAMKNGDFSALPTIIYDPSSLHTANGVLVRSPFAGNIIPAVEISPVGQNVVDAVPHAQRARHILRQRTVHFKPHKADDFDQFTVRVDHHLDDRNSLFGRYSYSKENRFDTFDSFCASANNVPGFGCNTLNGGQQALADYIALARSQQSERGPRLLHPGARRHLPAEPGQRRFDQSSASPGTSRSSLDFGVPIVTATGYDRLGEATNLPQDRHDNTYEWADSLSWTKGRNAFKFGAEIRHFQEELPVRFERARHAELHAVLHRAGVRHRVRRGERGRAAREMPSPTCCSAFPIPPA